jgi:hypothetical protein
MGNNAVVRAHCLARIRVGADGLCRQPAKTALPPRAVP